MHLDHDWNLSHVPSNTKHYSAGSQRSRKVLRSLTFGPCPPRPSHRFSGRGKLYVFLPWNFDILGICKDRILVIGYRYDMVWYYSECGSCCSSCETSSCLWNESELELGWPNYIQKRNVKWVLGKATFITVSDQIQRLGVMLCDYIPNVFFYLQDGALVCNPM